MLLVQDEFLDADTLRYLISPFMHKFEVRAIEASGAELDEVVRLHKANSHRLGFFPKGAFEDHACNRHILLAVDERDVLLGYLLYRVAKQRAMIAHLCTAEAARGKGIARALVQHLKEVTTQLAGIGLRCRQDYDARYVWAKFGFRAIDRKAGRSHDGHELTFWWFEHPHADLFTMAATDDSRQRVVIDANVFFDLQGRETTESEASKALLADWVQDAIELCVTNEMANEIDRSPNADLQKRSRVALTRFCRLHSDDTRFQKICDELKPLFPDSAVLRDESDLRQLAYAIAGNATYFVTRDAPLMQRCDSIYQRYGLHVLHPAEFISHLDVLAREEQYRPVRVLGSRLKGHVLAETEADWAIESFRDPACERVGDFQRIVRRCLSLPRTITGRIVADEQRNAVLFGVLETTSPDQLQIPILRITKHPLGPTTIRSFLRSTLDLATKEGCSFVSVTDQCLPAQVQIALREFGFQCDEEQWFKLAVRTVGSIDHLRSFLCRPLACSAEARCRSSMETVFGEVEASPSPTAISALESRFWPAKLENEGLPTFIIPIRAEWAQHFFDVELASEMLLGLREDLHLGIEGVYYCSEKNRYLSAPARILWYVSKGHKSKGSMTIKACSHLEEVVIGKAGELFKRFRRLGVYERRNVLSTAKGNPENDILALRFSMTELFTQPVTLDFLASVQILPPFMSPRKISAAQFAAIYKLGFEIGAV